MKDDRKGGVESKESFKKSFEKSFILIQRRKLMDAEGGGDVDESNE